MNSKKLKNALIFGLCAISTFAASFGAPKANNKSAKQPNVLIYITDDESWLERSAYGWSNIPTPAFDRVAKEGALFTHGYTSAPSCAPSRASLLTGRNFWELEQGAYIQAWLPAKFPRLPDLLQEGGYHTGYTGKGWGPGVLPPEGPKNNPAGNSFHTKKRKVPKYLGPYDYVENFKEFLADNKDGKPFFFWVGSIEPHSPCPVNGEELLEKEFGIKPADIKMPGFIPNDDTHRKMRAGILYEICHTDRELGKIIKILEERGELENTIIIVTGDNGTQIPYSKATPYDWGVHVPFAVMWPAKVKSGRTVDDFVSFIDIAPTVLQAANLPTPESMSGKSLMPLLLSDKSGIIDPTRNFIVTGLEWHGELPPWNSAARAVRNYDYEYIINYENRPLGRIPPNRGPKKQGEPWEELYDVKNDPWTLKNLADDPAYAKIKAEMKAKLEAYQKQTNDPRITGDMQIFNETRKFVEGRKASDYSQ